MEPSTPVLAPPIRFETRPEDYVHWRLEIAPPLARLVMDIQEDKPLRPGYPLKTNSYDLGVDRELADAILRLRFEHPEVRALVITSGKGAVYEWDGNKEIGQGRMEIVESVPPSRVTLTLDFTRPFEAHNIVDFTLEPRGNSTQVTWAIHGPSPFISKVMGIVFNVDKMIGKDFEAGLAALKTVSEQQSADRG